MRCIDKIYCYIQYSLWSRVRFINYLLLPCSSIYRLLTNLRYYFFQTPFKFQSKIICVGNAISGGAGKTPVVIRLLELLLLNKEFNVAVVTKGYHGLLITKKAIKVNLKNHSHKDVGDEALLIAEYASVFVSRSRILSIRMAEKNGARIIILDDGLQDNSIYKDFSILVVSTHHLKTKENHFLIPAGPMRESLQSSIKKVEIVIFADKEDFLLHRHLLKSKVILYQEEVIKNSQVIQGKKFILLSGIANPARIEKTIENLNIIIVKKYFFPDHHSFLYYDLCMIYNEAKKIQCKVLTTKKDFTRIHSAFHNMTVIIDYSIKIDQENKMMQALFI